MHVMHGVHDLRVLRGPEFEVDQSGVAAVATPARGSDSTCASRMPEQASDAPTGATPFFQRTSIYWIAPTVNSNAATTPTPITENTSFLAMRPAMMRSFL